MNNSNIIYCKTAEEYLTQLSLSSSTWWQDSKNCEWIFRGQDSSHQLIPTLYRKNLNANNLIYQDKFNDIHKNLVSIVPNMDSAITNYVNMPSHRFGDAQKKNLISLIKAAFVEVNLTENFLLECNRVRLPTPTLSLFNTEHSGMSSAEYLYRNLETHLVTAFTHPLKDYQILLRHAGFSRLIPFQFPEAFALARHHNVPSRLLDWSRNSNIAAFFSAQSNSNDDMCVWALNKKFFSQKAGEGQIAFYEKLSTTGLEFLHLQKGVFTDMIGIDALYYHHGKWPTLDEYILETYICPYDNLLNTPEKYIRKIILNASEKQELLKLLNRMDINKHSLMPTYDNVGQFVLTDC